VVLSHVTLQHITLGIEEKSKHASLAQQNDFGPTFFFAVLIIKAGTRDRKAVHLPKREEECNKNMI